MNDKDKHLEGYSPTEPPFLKALREQQQNQKIVDEFSGFILCVEQNDRISIVKQIASTVDSIEVTTHFQASLQQNRRLGELLAQ